MVCFASVFLSPVQVTPSLRELPPAELIRLALAAKSHAAQGQEPNRRRSKGATCEKNTGITKQTVG